MTERTDYAALIADLSVLADSAERAVGKGNVLLAEPVETMREAVTALTALLDSNKRMREALEDAADTFVATFAQAANPDDPAGWSDPDHFATYKRLRAALAPETETTSSPPQEPTT